MIPSDKISQHHMQQLHNNLRSRVKGGAEDFVRLAGWASFKVVLRSRDLTEEHKARIQALGADGDKVSGYRSRGAASTIGRALLGKVVAIEVGKLAGRRGRAAILSRVDQKTFHRLAPLPGRPPPRRPVGVRRDPGPAAETTACRQDEDHILSSTEPLQESIRRYPL